MPNLKELGIEKVLLLSDEECQTLFQMSLWRQVKVTLNSKKQVDGGFRFEEAIPPDTLMYYPWGVTGKGRSHPHSRQDFTALIESSRQFQIGGQESLGRGFVEQWIS